MLHGPISPDHTDRESGPRQDKKEDRVFLKEGGLSGILEEMKRLSNFPSENPNPVLQMAPDGRVLYANPSSANLLKKLGYSDEKPLNETWTGVVAKTLKTQEPATTEMKIGDRFFSLSFAPITRDRVNVYALDITEHIRTEKAIRKSEKTFRNLFDHHAAVKLIIDPATGRIIAGNHAAEELYGWSRKTLAKMNIRQINTKSPEEIEKSMKNAMDRKKIHFDFQHRLADGSLRDVEVFSSGVELGGRRYLYSIIHDITEQKKVEKEMEALQIQNWHLKKSESLSRMAGAIAYHFNNYLMGIMGNLELCLKVIKPDESPIKFLTEAMKVAEKASNISGLMLTYLGQKTSGKTPMDLGKVCRMSIPLIQTALPVNIIFESDIPPGGPFCYGNAHQIQQLAMNLVANAAESYEEKGAVNLTVKTVSKGEIPKQNRFPIDWHPYRDEYACLEVTDSGCGIEEQHIEKIFDPFFSTKSTGRGLDLAVVLGIVKANNGVITVESKRGEGSIFRFFVPLETDSTPLRQDLNL